MNLYSKYNSMALPMVKDVDGKKGIVTGYFANFDNVDSDGDIIRKGAFVKTVMENGPASNRPRIKHLFNHNPTQPLGKLTVLNEDAKGLYYESQVGTHTLGQDFIKMVESGLITEHSIGYRIIKRNEINSYEGYIKNPESGWHELTEIKLYEGSSLSAWGANELTPITGLKGSFNIDALVERQRAVEKFCKSTDASDETIEALLLHSKQLTQIILDIRTEPVHTQPQVEGVIQQFINTLTQ